MTQTGKVTVVGAGFYGSTTAQRLAEYDIFDEVVLTDIIDTRRSLRLEVIIVILFAAELLLAAYPILR